METDASMLELNVLSNHHHIAIAQIPPSPDTMANPKILVGRISQRIGYCYDGRINLLAVETF
jgi:hypothetical protein